jgi:DNA-binding cell septation regulator SpoVG
MAETTKKGNAPETRTVKVTYAGYTCVCIVKDWGDSESIDIEVKVGKQSVFKVYDCRIVDGENGKFLSFPSRKGSDGNYYNRARITDSDMCEAIIAAIEE